MNQPAQPVIETMTVREIGAQMARLREQFGLTVQEVSERLHIRTRYVSAIEEGRYELMPGKVYARGYVHTYAEFLGLNPDQIVTQCFANEAPATAPKPPSTRSTPTASLSTSHWRSYAMLAVGALVSLLVVTQLGGFLKDNGTSEEATVAPVPDAMLESVRNLMMPTAINHECLTSDTVLGCFYADNVTRALASLDDSSHLRFGGDIDVSGMAVPLPEEPASEPVPETDEPSSPSTADE